MAEVTQILDAIEQGDPHAAIIPSADLRRLVALTGYAAYFNTVGV